MSRREPKGRPEGRADIVIGLLLLAVCAAVFRLSSDLPSPPFVPLTPAFFPRLVAGLLALLALLLVGRGLRTARRRGPQGAGAPAGRLAPVLVVFAILGAYIALIPVLGFYASTFLFVTVLGTLLDGRRLRGLPAALVVATGTTLATYLVFTRYLRVLFPEGLLR